MLRVIFTFVAVALILWLTYLFSKHLGKSLGKSSSRYMRLIDQITLGQDRHIAVVQIGGKYLLVGITAGQINVLSEIEDDDLFLIAPDDEEKEEKMLNFKAVMDKLGDVTKRGR